MYPNLNNSYERLVGLERLEPNWDSCGSLPIDPIVINRATLMMLFLVDAITPYQINPLPTGRVEYRWRGPLGELILEVTHKDRMLYRIVKEGTCSPEAVIEDLGSLLSLIQSLYVEVRVKSCESKKCKTDSHRHNLPY